MPDASQTPEEAHSAAAQARTTILECPECQSHRATILETRPPKARCADCALAAGPEGLRDSYRKASQFAHKFGLSYLDQQWFVATPWLLDWAAGNVDTSANDHSLKISNSASRYKGGHRVPNKRGLSATRLRTRAAIKWRAVWLCHYAMSGGKVLACRRAHVTEHTVEYHLRNDEQFAALAEAAKAHAIDLLHTRCFQRALEGDLEPVYWQGIKVDHVRKFPERLQIEMLRAHMPNTFKTPGSGPINIDTGDKILVCDEATRAKLMAAHRERILALPAQEERVKTADTTEQTR